MILRAVLYRPVLYCTVLYCTVVCGLSSTLHYNRIHDNLLPRTFLYRSTYCSCDDARGQMKWLPTFPGPCPRPCSCPRPCCCTHCTCSRPCHGPCPGCVTATAPAPAPRTWGAPWSVWALTPTPFITPAKLWTLWTYAVTYKPVSGGLVDKC